MSNNYHENRARQMNLKMHGIESFQYENEPFFRDASMQKVNNPTRVAVDYSSIQLQAYQIYCEKGGPAFDNWLEAERGLSYNHYKQKE